MKKQEIFNERLFWEGFELDNSTGFKLVPTWGRIRELASYQSSLIELIQGYACSDSAEKEDGPLYISTGLDLLKSIMLNEDQLIELEKSRIRTRKEKKRNEDRKMDRLTKRLKKDLAISTEKLNKTQGKFDDWIEELKKGKTKEELEVLREKVFGTD